eukprot:5850069-Pyramimonas_sp.AAC.5
MACFCLGADLVNRLGHAKYRETADACKVAERMGKKLEGFLAHEIESHTCPICYELMIAPTYAPMILFPCGEDSRLLIERILVGACVACPPATKS